MDFRSNEIVDSFMTPKAILKVNIAVVAAVSSRSTYIEQKEQGDGDVGTDSIG